MVTAPALIFSAGGGVFRRQNIGMKVKSVEKKENSVVVLEVEVASEEFEAALERAYRKQKNGMNVPGFRKGRPPQGDRGDVRRFRLLRRGGESGLS